MFPVFFGNCASNKTNFQIFKVMSEDVFVSFTLAGPRNNELRTLAVEIVEAALERLAGTDAEPLIAPLKEKVDNLSAVMKPAQVNPYSSSTRIADEAVDEMWSCVWALAKILVKHPNLEKRKLAAQVYDIMYKYGNVTNLARDDEYSRLTDMMEDFDAFGEENLAKCDLDEWIAEMRKRIAAYHSAESGRLDTVADYEKEAGVVEKARGEVEVALREFLRKVEALVIINGRTDYESFISYVNGKIKEVKAKMKARKTGAENAEEGEQKNDSSKLPQRDDDPSIAPGLQPEPEEDESEEPDDGGSPGTV